MMIHRCFNKVAITSQDRLQPMDKWEDYPIKVIDIAPLIMVTLPTVSSFSTCGCFLRGGRSSSGDLPPLSLVSGWPPGANGSLPANGGASRTLGLMILWVQGKGGQTDPDPGPSRPGSVAPSLPWVIRWLCTLPLPFEWFWPAILASKTKVLRAWSSVFYASIPGGVPS
jgi:hypothetical protein